MMNQWMMHSFIVGVAMAASQPASSLPPVTQEAAASSAEAVQQATAQSSGASFGAVACLTVLIVLLASVLVLLILRLIRTGQVSVIDPMNFAKGTLAADNTVIAGGQFVLEQLDENGYTIFSQPLSLSRLTGEDQIVVIPPKGVAQPVFQGKIVQTINLKRTENTNTISHISPLVFYQRKDGAFALCANAENVNPVTFEDGSVIDRMPLNELQDRIFYLGDQPLIVTRHIQNRAQSRHVQYKGGKKPGADIRGEEAAESRPRGSYAHRD